MDPKDFENLLYAKYAELDDLARRRLPVLIGRIAKDHFQDNFRLGGFVNGGLHKWAEAKRRISGSASAAARNPTLLSGRNHLFSSINYYPRNYAVRIANELVYAPIHNEGGEIPVTDRMRRFAWHKFYEASGRDAKAAKGNKKKSADGSLSPEARFWKGMALTKKKTITIPKRQFIGDSQELNDAIAETIENEIIRILKS